MFINAEESERKTKLAVKDDFELQFDVKDDVHNESRHNREGHMIERMSAQAAYETNSSIGSENCSVESIHLGLEMPGFQ